MAVNALNLAVSLRPWRNAGVSALLCRESADMPTDAASGAGDAVPVHDAARSVRESFSGVDSVGPVMKSAGARGADHARIREKSGNGGNTPDIRADMPGNTSVVPSLSEAEKRRSVSPAARWPASWRALLEKTPPAPLVWTYEELGSDLLGDASPERSHCLKTLIGALSLPRGTSAFWPLDLPGGSAPGDDIAGSRGEDVAAGALFASGVALLRASMVMYFGAGAASRSGFAVQLRYPFTQRISGGVLHILLPPLSALAESPDRIDKAVAYLRSVLSDHPLLQGKR